jgi:D-alanyl-D-alanine carboxypeptidase
MHISVRLAILTIVVGIFSYATQAQYSVRIAAYVAAFNAGESGMREFMKQNWSAEALKTTGLEERLNRYRQVREMLGMLQLYRILGTSDTSVSAIMRSNKEGWLEIRFTFEKADPHGIQWVSIQPAEDPDQAPIQKATSDADLVLKTTVYLDSLAERDQFSGVTLIARHDSVLLSRAFGFADREKKIPNSVDTRFNVGSINKVFTRVAILQLESGGNLALTDTLGRFLPDYPNRDAVGEVTVQHLLTMSSGIGDFFGPRFEAADKEKIQNLADYLPLFADQPLEFAPGTNRRYSNGGYIVLGLIIERVSGMSYYDYVRKNVYAPAGMLASDWYPKSGLPQNVALGYSSPMRGSNYGTLPGIGSSAGGGYSTAGDLLRFIEALKKGTITLPDIGGGLHIAGGAPGLNAAVEWDPSTDYVVIVLSNFDPPLAERVAGRIRKLLP